MNRSVRAQAAALVLILVAGGCASSQACRSCGPASRFSMPNPFRPRGMSAPMGDCGCDGGAIMAPPILPGPAMPIVPGPPVIVPGPAPIVTGQASPPVISTPSK